METSNEGFVPGSGEAAQLDFSKRVGALLFEPRKLFEDLSRKSSWLGVFVIMSVVAIASSFALSSRMDRETYLRKAIQMNPITRNLPEEQIKVALSRPPGILEKAGAIFAPINLIIVFAIMAGVFLATFVLMGANITFKKSLAVTVWAMFPSSVILMLLGFLMIFIKDPDTLELSPASNVASNLGWLVTEQNLHPVLSSLLSSVDLFSFWTMALLSIGFSCISDRKLTIRKSALAIVVLWALWVCGKAGVAALMS